MARIFISYRRADSLQITGRLYDRLERDFGKYDVFKDVDNIPPGRDFRGVLREATANCEVMLVIIGRNWVNVTDQNGNRRLDDPDDFVRLEVETGLQRDNTLVIPVLVENATMPLANMLPDSLKELAYNSAVKVGNDPDFHRDMDRLIRHLEAQLSDGTEPEKSFIDGRVVFGGVLALLAIILIGFASQNLDMFGFGTDTSQTPESTEIAQNTDEPQAIATTAEPTESSTPSTTPTASDTPGIATIVAELDATATSDRATAYYQETLSARATEYAVGTQNIVDATATATLWTDTPTPNMTASIVAYRTQQAETATQDWIDSWTDTPTATNTPTETPTLTPSNTPTPDPLDLALDLAMNFSGDNDDWEPFVQVFDGVEMVLVPAGCFPMGNDPDAYYGESDTDGGEQCFDEPFWIDRYEVTNAQFAQFLNTNGNQSADGNEYLDSDDDDRQIHNVDGTWIADEGYEDHPAIEISWFGARDYCSWRDGALPTEVQWEYAARGPDALYFPWGNEWDADNTVNSGNSGGQTAVVGSIPAGASWVGALDMSGNVWEWVLSQPLDYPYVEGDGRNDNLDSTDVLRGLRGGSWSYQFTYNFRVSSRNRGSPSDTYSNFGGRCSRFNLDF